MGSARVCRKSFLGVIGILCVLGIAGYVLFQDSNLRAESATSKEIAKEIQKIKEAGEPTTIEELVPPDIPDGENGALVYNQAFYLLKELKGKHQEECKYFPYEGQVKWDAVSESEKEKVRNLLLDEPDFTRFYQLLKKASGMKCQFLERKGYEAGAAVKLLHLASLRECARMLAARADIQAEKGEIDNALSDCLTGLKISDSLSGEPILITGLFGIATDSIALDRMEEIMKKEDAKPETYRALMKEVMRARNDKTMYRCLLGERVIWDVQEFPAIKKQVEEKNIEPIIESLGLEQKDRNRIVGIIQKDPVGFVEENELVYLKIMAKWIALSKKPYFETKKEFPGLEKELSGLPDEKAGLVKLFAVASSRALTQVARIDALLGDAEIALACHLYKSKYKDYPASLKELSPEFLLELPLDPFPGKDYIYRKKDKGFIVYSVGDNLKDDGGIPQFSEQGKKGDFDIVWEDKGGPDIKGNLSTKESLQMNTVREMNEYLQSDTAKGIMEKMRQCTVLIQTTKKTLLPNPSGAAREGMMMSSGSGIIIGPEGYILTCKSVIANNPQDMTVTLSDGRIITGAKVLEADSVRDIVLLKIDSPVPLPYVQLGNSDKVKLGELIIACGYSGPDRVFTSTVGIVNKIMPPGFLGASSGLPDVEIIASDAQILPGFTGGAFVNMKGEVIGLILANAEKGSLGPSSLAISINYAKPMVNDLIK